MLKNSSKLTLAALAIAGLSASLTVALPAAAQAPAAAAAPTVVRKVIQQQDLTTLPGQTMALVTVDIPVGGREGRHQHAGTLMAYVLQGDLTLDYEGKPTMTYKVGDTFYVEPGKIHEGQNKGTVPVKLIATFVWEKAKPMTTQVPQ